MNDNEKKSIEFIESQIIIAAFSLGLSFGAWLSAVAIYLINGVPQQNMTAALIVILMGVLGMAVVFLRKNYQIVKREHGKP